MMRFRIPETVSGGAYRDRMLAIADEVEAQGVSRYRSAPPLYRFLWRLGFRVKPPLYQSFVMSVVTNGAGFAITLGLFKLLFDAFTDGSSPSATIVASCVGGLVFGLIMAFTLGRQARRIQLPPLIDK
jgi:hypothetical protein